MEFASQSWLGPSSSITRREEQQGQCEGMCSPLSGGTWVSHTAVQALMVMATGCSGRAPFGEEIVAPLHHASSLPQSPLGTALFTPLPLVFPGLSFGLEALVQTWPRLHLYTFPPIALLPGFPTRVGRDRVRLSPNSKCGPFPDLMSLPGRFCLGGMFSSRPGPRYFTPGPRCRSCGSGS